MPDTSAQQPVLVIMGVAGCGKSTVAALLAGQLGWDFQEGDDLHSAENVEKMASGQPLTDDDRWPWLDAVASWIREHDFAGIPGISHVFGAQARLPGPALRTPCGVCLPRRRPR